MSNQALDVKKQELASPEKSERARDRRVYVPNTDIVDKSEFIMLVADMPGVDDKSVEITLEKNVLTINGLVEFEKPEGYSLMYAEYGIGDYERSFVLPNEIDREKIEAVVKDGVLMLKLPKSDAGKTRKISVKAG